MSAIDPTKPVAGSPTTQSVRDNFAAAKSEIEALQGFITLNGTLIALNGATGQITTLGTTAGIVAPLTASNTLAGKLSVIDGAADASLSVGGILNAGKATATLISDTITVTGTLSVALNGAVGSVTLGPSSNSLGNDWFVSGSLKAGTTFEVTGSIVGTHKVVADAVSITAAGDGLFATAAKTGATGSGGMGTYTGDVVDGTSGTLLLQSGHATGDGISGAASMFTGNADGAGITGDAYVYTGDASSSGNTGFAGLGTGSATSGNTGEVQIWTGNTATGDKTGAISITSGANPGPGSSGKLTITSGDASTSGGLDIHSGTSGDGATSGSAYLYTGASSAGAGNSGDAGVGSGDVDKGASGPVYLYSGQATGAGGNTGDVQVNTGPTAGSGGGTSGAITVFTGGANGPSGALSLATGDSAAGTVGALTLTTGDAAAGNSGTITLTTGAAVGGTAGDITVTLGAGATAATSGRAIFDLGTAKPAMFDSGAAGTEPLASYPGGSVVAAFAPNAEAAGYLAVSFASLTRLVGMRGDGVRGTPTGLVNGDEIMRFQAGGYDGTNWSENQAAIQFLASGTWATGVARATTMRFQTTATGETTPIARMVILPTGRIRMSTTGSTTDDGVNTLQVTGSGIFSTTLTSAGLLQGSTLAASVADLTKQISLFSTTYGFSITSNRLNYVVPSGGSHFFVVNAVDVANITSTGLNNTVIGATTAVAGTFTTVQATTHRIGASGPTWTSGTGTPEGAVTAPIGSLFSRTDGGAATTLYVKESGAGNTGWVAK